MNYFLFYNSQAFVVILIFLCSFFQLEYVVIQWIKFTRFLMVIFFCVCAFLKLIFPMERLWWKFLQYLCMHQRTLSKENLVEIFEHSYRFTGVIYFGRWENYFDKWENYFGRWGHYFGRLENYFGRAGGKMIFAAGEIILAGGKIILAMWSRSSSSVATENRGGGDNHQG